MMSEFRLQTVIDRIEDGLLIRWLEQCVVFYGIERQSAESDIWISDGEVQRRSAYVSWGAACGLPEHIYETVRRIAAESDQLLNQRGIGRISVTVTPDVDSHDSDVGDIDDVMPRQFTLNSKIPVVAGWIAQVRVERYGCRESKTVRNAR